MQVFWNHSITFCKEKTEFERLIIKSCRSKPVWLKFSMEYKKIISFFGVLNPVDFHCVDKHPSKYLLLHSAEESKSYSFGMQWGWVNVLGELFLESITMSKNKIAPQRTYTHLFDCTDVWAKISQVQFNKHFMSPCAPLNSVGIENHFTREPANATSPSFSFSLLLCKWVSRSPVTRVICRSSVAPKTWNLTALRQTVCFSWFLFSTRFFFPIFQERKQTMLVNAGKWYA